MFLSPAARARPLAAVRETLPYQIGALVSSNNLFVTLSPVGTSPLLMFRDPAIANGDPFFRRITMTQMTIASGNTLGTASGNVPFRLWMVGVDTGSGVIPALFQSVTGGSTPTAVAMIDEGTVQSTTGGTGGSTAATYYSPVTLTSRPIRILGYLEWGSGLTTAGTWASKPTKIQLFGPGIKKPGDVVQVVRNQTGAVATGTTQIPFDDTIPQNTEGDQYMTQAISPTSSPNLLSISSKAALSTNVTGTNMTMALFQDSTANALQAISRYEATAGVADNIQIDHLVQAASTASTTFKIRAGTGAAGTTTFNGVSAARIFAGVMNSFMQITELMV